MNSRTDAIINEIEKVIIGKRNVVERVLMAILSEGCSAATISKLAARRVRHRTVAMTTLYSWALLR